MFNLWLEYPSPSEETEIVKTTTSPYQASIRPVLRGDEVVTLQDLVRRVPVADNVIQFAVNLVNRSRPQSPLAPAFAKQWIRWGAGPRASQYLILGAKTRAILQGRHTPDIDDVRALTGPVLRHRIVPSFNAEAEGVTSVQIIEKLLTNTD
jgi:MoxR-like ATPase